jgi:hypothetical protein
MPWTTLLSARHERRANDTTSAVTVRDEARRDDAIFAVDLARSVDASASSTSGWSGLC